MTTKFRCCHGVLWTSQCARCEAAKRPPHANEKHNSVLSGVCDRLSQRVEALEKEKDAERDDRLRVYAENQTLRDALEAYRARERGDENG